MMNIDRRDAKGRIVPGETNQQQTYITTAGDKTCFMYQKLVEMTAMECIQPEEYFVWGEILPTLLERVNMQCLKRGNGLKRARQKVAKAEIRCPIGTRRKPKFYI